MNTGARVELKWWEQNIGCAHKAINQGLPKLVITTDASLSGWGAVLENQKTGGRWSNTESQEHINYLEPQAVFFWP